MNASGVSPERWDTICAYPARWHTAIASKLTVRIWFSLTSHRIGAWDGATEPVHG